MSEMLATKERERNALEKIEKIVDDLGEDSYIKAAFEGCFEIAKRNIENGFGDSMSARLKSMETSMLQEKSRADQMEAIASEQAEELRKCTLTPEDLARIERMTTYQVQDLEETVESEAQTIVNFAEDPASNAFIEAVKRHRHAVARLDAYQRMLDRIQAALRPDV